MRGTVVACRPQSRLVRIEGKHSAVTVTPKAFLDKASSSEFKAWLVQCRRELHAIPELFFQENETSAYIRARLDGLGIPYEHPLGVTGVRGMITGGESRGQVGAIMLLDISGGSGGHHVRAG